MEAKQIIEKLSLRAHPEGGWFRETWRSDIGIDRLPGSRASATAIHFLLETNQFSEWHRVDAAEIWLWHCGDPLTLSIKTNWDGMAQEYLLGPDVLEGQQPQILVPAAHWQTAVPVPNAGAGYTLVSCIVSPGFEFSGFELRKS